MSDRTHIQWTDASWNPIRAGLVNFDTKHVDRLGWQCQRVSPGCQNCYAEGINKRLGTGLAYDAKGMAASEPLLDEKTLVQPLSWRKPRRVFVCSMTDIAGEWVPDEWLDRMFAVMALTPQHEYQVLTKRPERMRAYLAAEDPDRYARVDETAGEISGESGVGVVTRWPLPNVWIGTSVEDQERADERIPELLATPAAVRFLSCEPLLGPVTLRVRTWRAGAQDGQREPDGYTRRQFECSLCRERVVDFAYGNEKGLEVGEREAQQQWAAHTRKHSIDWVIVGGESGPRARPMDLAWARSLVAQCKAAGVAVFVKQLGAKPRDTHTTCAEHHHESECWPDGTKTDFHDVRLRDRKGGDPDEWPEDLRVREWPKEGVIA